MTAKKPETVGIITGQLSSQRFVARVGSDPTCRATSARSEREAAQVVAWKWFFGTGVKRNFPDAAEKVTVVDIGPNQYQGEYRR